MAYSTPMTTFSFPFRWPSRHLISALALPFLGALQAHAADAPFRPPAVPLVAHSPYFSIWSENDKLTDGPTRHWTTAEQPLESLIRIDGKAYRLMGVEPGNVPPFPQVGLRVTPTSSVYDFDDTHVHVTLIFTSPLLPNDLEVLSRPVTYLTWIVGSVDHLNHNIQLYGSASASLCIDDGRKSVAWSRETDGLLTALKAGNTDQTLFDPRGDSTRINWGYLYVAAPAGESKACIAANGELLDSFVKTGALPAADETPGATFNDKQGALAFAFDLGPVNTTALRHLLLGYDESYEVQYGGQNLLPYWKREGATASEMLQEAEKDYNGLGDRCHKFDDALMTDLATVGGYKYAQVCALAYRECLAANGLAADANKQPLLFTKENTSNGDIATVDVIYPQAPIFLLLSPTLAKASIAPVMVYAASNRWKFPNAPHDLGTYPVATASGDASEPMPVEESGNLLLLCDGIVHAGGGTDFLTPWWPQLTQWASFLEKFGLDPGDQLCTDDFMGGFAHNANLSVKAILALAAYGDMCGRRGDAAGAKKYGDMARVDALHWMKVARDGDHYRLAFDKPGWSQKYNLVWDKILGLGIFPPEVARTELASYLPHLQKYGLPLDSRTEDPKNPDHHAMVKSDWSTWTATLADNPADFDRIESPFYDYLNATTARNPAADLYRADSLTEGPMHARPVVGGFFMKMLADPTLWKKWASADSGNPGPWAPMPPQPVYTFIFPAPGRPLTWRYTRFAPAANWAAPGFDDSKWEHGPNRVWEKEKSPKPDLTVPPEFKNVVKEVWMRATVKLPDPLPPNFDLMLNGHYGNEVFLNNIRVADAPDGDSPMPAILHPDAQAQLKPGTTVVIAVHIHDGLGHSWVNAGLAGSNTP
jgi:hypothetical protein